MLSSRQHVVSKRATQKKQLEDEKKKAAAKEEEKIRSQKKSSTGLPPKRNTRPPLTPPSKRVTKTQFFSQSSSVSSARSTESKSFSSRTPSQSSARLTGAKDKPSKGSSGARLTSNQKSDRPSVREFIKKAREENRKKEEVRPGTATLTNPVVLKNAKAADYDSYESDFEACSSTDDDLIEDVEEASSSSSASSERLPVALQASAEEEKKLDSGTFDLPEQKYKQVLHDIKEKVERESRANPASLPDEGFEDVKSLPSSDGNGGFINFSGAQRKLKQNKRRKRGEEILSMIKLDSYNFTIFDMVPMGYDRYIKVYGGQNCAQASSQTGDDNIDEECQTELVITRNMWTQAPVAFSKTVDAPQRDYLKTYKEELAGVGNDDERMEETSFTIDYNKEHFRKFMVSAGGLLLNLLQENSGESLKELQNSDSPTFSNGYIECNTKTVPILKNTFVSCISYSPMDPSQFLTVHKQAENCDFLCTWYLSNLNQPERVFVCHGNVACCCFSDADTKFIFAGTCDGTVCVWNSSKQINSVSTEPQVPVCVSEIGLGHTNKIISIQSALCGADEANQLCSLDVDGNIIFWSITSKHFILTQNNKISLPDVHCTSMLINKLDPNHLFVSTTTGCVAHTLISGARAQPKIFYPPMTSCVTCLAACPLSGLYFLAGFENGCVALYSRTVEKPLIVMINKNSESRVRQIEWSCTKPCVFYVKHQGGLLDIWDLSTSDMLPAISVPFKHNLEYIKIMSMSGKCRNGQKSCMLLGYGNGDLQLHVLNKEHGQNSLQDFKQDVKKFLKYVNRL